MNKKEIKKLIDREIKEKENITNITINNFFSCSPKNSKDCDITRNIYSEDECLYIKDKNQYKKIFKRRYINLD